MRIFFDVDGVLIDGWHQNPERRRPWHTTLAEDLNLDVPIFLELVFGVGASPKFNAPIHACAKGERDLKHLLTDVLPHTGYKGSVDAFLAYWFEKDAHLNDIIFGAVRKLSARSDVSLYVATGQEHHRAAYLWDQLNFKAYFREMFYSAKLGHLKNEAAFFDAINRRLGILPGDRPLFFDDTTEVVLMAREAGWDAQLVDTPADVIYHPRLKALLG